MVLFKLLKIREAEMTNALLQAMQAHRANMRPGFNDGTSISGFQDAIEFVRVFMGDAAIREDGETSNMAQSSPSSPSTLSDCRQEFLEWHKPSLEKQRMDGGGRYIDDWTQALWSGWCGAREARPREIPVLSEKQEQAKMSDTPYPTEIFNIELLDHFVGGKIDDINPNKSYNLTGTHLWQLLDGYRTLLKRESVHEWQRIIFAPPHKLLILFAWHATGDNWKMGIGSKGSDDVWDWDGRRLDKEWHLKPTHWRYLPEAPAFNSIEGQKP